MTQSQRIYALLLYLITTAWTLAAVHTGNAGIGVICVFHWVFSAAVGMICFYIFANPHVKDLDL
jgi:hypothetical protein